MRSHTRMYQGGALKTTAPINPESFFLFSETIDRNLDKAIWWFCAIFVAYFGAHILAWALRGFSIN